MLADFLKPNKWKLVGFVFFAILAFTLGYNPCGSACSILDAFCVDVCVVKYSFFLWPFSLFLGPNDILKFSIGSIFFIIGNAAYWYIVSCFIVGSAENFRKPTMDEAGNIRKKWKLPRLKIRFTR